MSKSLERRHDLLKQAVTKKDCPSRGYYELAMLYLRGALQPEHPELPFELLRKAADDAHKGEKEYFDACFELAIRYFRGDGLPRDVPRAMAYFHKVGSEKNSALDGLAVCRQILGGHENERLAFEHFRVHGSGRMGRCWAKLQAANCWLTGKGTVRNPELALPLLNEVVEWGTSRERAAAQNILGWCWLHGVGVGSSDAKKAAECFLAGAGSGDFAAQRNLGRCYLVGKGVDQDKQRAVYWFYRAALGGDPLAQVLLAECLVNGDGIQPNRGEARRWFRLALTQDDSESAQVDAVAGLAYLDGLSGNNSPPTSTDLGARSSTEAAFDVDVPLSFLPDSWASGPGGMDAAAATATLSPVAILSPTQVAPDVELAYSQRVNQRPTTLSAMLRNTTKEDLAAELRALSKTEQTLLCESIAPEIVAAVAVRLPDELLSAASFGTDLRASTVSELDEQERANFRATTKSKVFGENEPSTKSFRSFLRDLTGGRKTTYEEKKEIVRIVNFWKDELGLALEYEGEICRLGPKRDAGQGAFQLRRPGRGKELYSRTKFPSLRVVRAESRRD